MKCFTSRFHGMLLTLILLLSGVGFLDSIWAEANEANEIAQRSFSLPSPGSIKMQVQLNLINPRGDRRSRSIDILQKKFDEDFSAEILHFLQPIDVAGTKFLIINRPNKKTESRVFTPSDGKVRLISGSSKNNSFMGTDFSYYDLEPYEYEDFTYSLLSKDQTIADVSFSGRKFYVLEAIPKDIEAPYSKMHFWIDAENYQIRRIEAFEPGAKVKDIYIIEIMAQGDFIIPKTLLAINHSKDGHRTLWQVVQSEINISINDSVFQVQNLR